jgi:glycosyltransferase involved in cell wall biosynthesis
MSPGISVVIPTYNAASSIVRCLESLFAGSFHEPFEVVVVDSSTDATPEIIADRFPEVKLHRLPARAFPGQARNVGMAHAGADLIAFTDADCIPDPDWLEQIERAHRNAFAAVGGVVDNANPESYVGWASYFCKFSQWMPQAREGPMVEIPTCCLAIKRSAFEAHGPFLEGTLSSDTAFNWRLTGAGTPPRLVPSIRVAHINRDRLAVFLSNLSRHGRDFARVRVREQGLSGRRRVALALMMPLLPPLLLARAAARVARSGTYARRFVLASPLVLLGHAVWASGELRGYLAPTREGA